MAELIKNNDVEDVEIHKKTPTEKKEVSEYKPFSPKEEPKEELPDLEKAYDSKWENKWENESELLQWKELTYGREKAGKFERDGKNVYNMLGDKIKWVDYKTFQVVNDNYAKDKNHIYDMLWNEMTSLDPAPISTDTEE